MFVSPGPSRCLVNNEVKFGQHLDRVPALVIPPSIHCVKASVFKKEVRYIWITFGSIQLLAACCFVGKETIVERKRTHHSNCLKKLNACSKKRYIRYLNSTTSSLLLLESYVFKKEVRSNKSHDTHMYKVHTHVKIKSHGSGQLLFAFATAFWTNRQLSFSKSGKLNNPRNDTC